MKTLEQGNFENKKVLLRCEMNVPVKDGNITDDTRIRESLPTIKYLLEHKAAVIIMAHLGRPEGIGYEEAFSLKPVAEHLSKLLGINVTLAGDSFGDKTSEQVSALKAGEILMLENVRFVKGETKGDEAFAQKLASYGEVYVNDAFGTTHRAHSSTAVIAKFFPNDKYVGKLLEHEIVNLEKLLREPQHPFTAIIGGAKVSTKIDVLKNLVDKVDNLIVGGGMAYTFVKALGGKIGNSLCENDKVDMAKEVMQVCKEKNVNFILPVDTLIADAFDNNANRKTVPTMEIPDGWEGMDIGEKSIENFKDVVRKSKTILWNGPLGVFEMDNFARGTLEVGKCVGDSGAFSAVGGGDSIAAVNKLGIASKISYISTGGGAMIEYLEGKTLPGIAALD
ncbi:MAG: phosphoglycerate kinase [Bacteroidales bacterium]|jgi:phosphoglycerate kinase|nr:phosphoglycerate kinase [Bacteroidales bacterium]